MSVSLLHPAHIDVLTAAGKQFGILADSGAAVDIGQILLDANRAAYIGRDDYTQPGMPPPPDYRRYTFMQPHGILDPVAVLKAADGYLYQVDGAPVTDDAQATVTHALDFVRMLAAAVIATQPALGEAPSRASRQQAYKLTPAYGRAPWSVTDSTAATRAHIGPHPFDGTGSTPTPDALAARASAWASAAGGAHPFDPLPAPAGHYCRTCGATRAGFEHR